MNVICRARSRCAAPAARGRPALMSPFGWERFKSGAALNREAAQSRNMSRKGGFKKLGG